MIRRAAFLVAVMALVAVATPPVAGAQSDALGPLPAAPTQTTAPAPAPTTTSSSGDDGLATWQQVLLFGGAAVLLAGIAAVIVRDAHRRAPVKASAPDASAPALSARERERRQRQKRNRAKAARQQRKRNRTR